MIDNKLGTKRVSLLFIEYVMPGILGMIILSLYGIIDGLFIGRTIGPIGIAAMNLTLPYLSIVMALSITITVGGTTFIGIELGKGNKKGTKQIFTLTALTMIVVGLIYSIISFCLSGGIAKLLGATNSTFTYVKDYILAISPFIVFYMFSVLLDLVLRAVGKPVFSMIALIFSSILNIILDYIFVIKFSMGPKGAGLATGLAFTIGCLVYGIPYFKKDFPAKIIKTKIDFKIIGKVLYNGSSEGLTEIAAAVVTFLFNLTLLKYLGEMGVSAYTVINYVCYITTAILIGISDGIKPLISYNYGAKNYNRIKSVFKLSIITGLFVGIFTILIVRFYGENLVKIFVDADKDFLEITLEGAKIYTLAFLINGINIVTSAYFTSIAKAKESMIISLCRGLLLIPVALIILPNIFGVNGIWMSVPIAEIITLIISITMFLRKYKEKY